MWLLIERNLFQLKMNVFYGKFNALLNCMSSFYIYFISIRVATLEITEQYRKATRDDGKTNVRQSKPAKPSQGAVSTGGYIKR